MAQITALRIPNLTFLTDHSAATHELRQLCSWGATPACEGPCSCAVLIRINCEAGGDVAYVLEPGATVEEFDAAQAFIEDLPDAYLVLSATVFRSALLQC